MKSQDKQYIIRIKQNEFYYISLRKEKNKNGKENEDTRKMREREQQSDDCREEDESEPTKYEANNRGSL